ncbi:MAG: electron transfer flavoprotein subunit alpha/FixB family protein [Rhodospirillaceae bacterium]|nr:electron transfer flavoprotein subunit alpha/FixB family protein [Rhodospirillaceae bacterium]
MTEQAKPASSRAKQDEALLAYKGVWVSIELERGHVHPVSWELIGKGRQLADTLGVPLSGILLAPPDAPIQETVADAHAYGADTVYVMADPILAEYRTQPYAKGMVDLIKKYQPEILLIGATTLGRDLASAVATDMETGLTADCTELDIDLSTRSMAATRPTFGGTLLCTIHTLKARPQMATVRPRVMPMPEHQQGRTGETIMAKLEIAEDDIITKVLSFIPDRDQDTAQLAFADYIVAGGRGLGKLENFQLLRDLADVLGAEIGCTRPIVQAGGMTIDHQIGQTGKTIRPKLYIAAGISGAIQHRVGVEGADCIIAINADPNAPIFDFAHYGIVGDALTILPALTDAFRRRLAAGQAGR